jgi:hypothetical protein
MVVSEQNLNRAKKLTLENQNIRRTCSPSFFAKKLWVIELIGYIYLVIKNNIMTKDFYKYSFYALIFGLIANSIGQGTLQDNVEFAGVANEIAVFVLVGAMFVISAGIAISEFIKSVKTPKS